MQPNITHVILQAPQPTVEAYLAEVNVAAVLEAVRQIPSSRTLEVSFVGPTADPARSLVGIQQWNAMYGGRPCEPLVPLLTGASGDQLLANPPKNGYVIFEDINAGSFTNDTAQSVILKGPTTIGPPVMVG